MAAALVEKGCEAKAGKGPGEGGKESSDGGEAADGGGGGDGGDDEGWIGWESSAELIKSCIIVARFFGEKGGRRSPAAADARPCQMGDARNSDGWCSCAVR